MVWWMQQDISLPISEEDGNTLFHIASVQCYVILQQCWLLDPNIFMRYRYVKVFR